MRMVKTLLGAFAIGLYIVWCIPWILLLILARIVGSVSAGAIAGWGEAKSYWEVAGL